MKIERHFNRLTLQLHGDCEFEEFFEIAERFQKIMNIGKFSKSDSFDNLYWKFRFNCTTYYLNYSVDFGVFVYAKYKWSEESIRKVKKYLIENGW